jgi:hypothetical protein
MRILPSLSLTIRRGRDADNSEFCFTIVSMAPTPPFALEHQLTRELDGPARHVPGYPCVSLEDRSMVWDLLAREFCSDDLDRVANRLWWMSKQDNGNISPLHRQLVKRRTIVVGLSIHTPYSIRRLMEYGIWNATHMELNPYIWKLRNDVIYIIN